MLRNRCLGARIPHTGGRGLAGLEVNHLPQLFYDLRVGER
jgi:hypothetical protein